MAKVLESGVYAGRNCSRDVEEPLSDILAQISRVKQKPHQRLQTPPPSYDAGLHSKPWDYVQMPQASREPVMIRNVAADFRTLLPMPEHGAGSEATGLNYGVNLRV